MALPKPAQKQLDEAIKQHNEAYAGEPLPTPEAPKLAEVPNDNAPSESIIEDQNTLPEVPAAEGEDAADAGPEDFEHKYKVLQGKYNAEVPILQNANNALTGRVTEMEQQLNQMIAAQATPSEPVEPGSHVTAEEIEDYGSDMIDVVKRAAREEFEPLLAQLQQENGQLRGLLGSVQESTVRNDRQTMLDTLDGEVANWRELNAQPEFLGWLENVDPYSGHKKLDLLRQAFEGNNVSRVKAFFKGYLNENAAFSTRQEPSTAGQEPHVNLDTLVAPGRASDGNDTRAQEGNATVRAFTQQEIGSFYNDVNRGVYRNNPDEKNRIEAEIFEAQSANQIT